MSVRADRSDSRPESNHPNHTGLGRKGDQGHGLDQEVVDGRQFVHSKGQRKVDLDKAGKTGERFVIRTHSAEIWRETYKLEE